MNSSSPGYQDALVFVLIFSGLFLILRKKNRELGFKIYPKWFVPALVLFHYAVSLLSIYYVLNFGGDSVKYWSLTADLSQHANSWMEYWGYNTFFVQWLNYLPSKVLGLHYLSGCLIYSTLSLMGFIWLIEVVSPLYLSAVKSSRFFAMSLLLIFFLPGPHFWTGLVSKEALIWFFLILLLKSSLKSRLIPYFLAVGLLVWLRPVVGLLALGVSSVYFLSQVRLSRNHYWTLWTLLVISGILGLGLLMYITGISSLSGSPISDFSRAQYKFLEGFNPNTIIPMENYSVLVGLITVGFRPFLGEILTFWGVFVGLENMILVLLALGIIPSLFYTYGQKQKFLYLTVLIVGILLFFYSIVLTVNVLGIMIRLKSSVVPFLAISGWYGWFLHFQKRNNSRII